MKFPFSSHKKETDIRDLVKKEAKKDGKPEAPKEVPKATGLFKRMRQRRLDVNALIDKFHAIEKMTDPAERLMEYKAIREACGEMLKAMNKNSKLPAIGTTLSGLAMTGASIPTLNPFLAAGGLFTMGAGFGLLIEDSEMTKKEDEKAKPNKWSVSPALTKDYKAIANLVVKLDTNIDTILKKEDLVNIAKSPRYDEAIMAFPSLKDRFQAAIAKEKVLQDNKPAEPAAPAEKPGIKFK